MHVAATALTGLFGTACFAAFSWGVKGHFRQTGSMPLGMKVTSGISLLLFAWFILHLAAGVGPAWPLAIFLFSAAITVFFWAIRATRSTPPTLAFDTDAPSFLLQQGPYQFVRHPFYLAYLMFWVGTAVIAHGILAWAAPAVMFSLYTYAASREENKFAASSMSGAYAAYRARAGMFLPRASALKV